MTEIGVSVSTLQYKELYILLRCIYTYYANLPLYSVQENLHI